MEIIVLSKKEAKGEGPMKKDDAEGSTENKRLRNLNQAQTFCYILLNTTSLL